MQHDDAFANLMHELASSRTGVGVGVDDDYDYDSRADRDNDERAVFDGVPLMSDARQFTTCMQHVLPMPLDTGNHNAFPSLTVD